MSAAALPIDQLGPIILSGAFTLLGVIAMGVFGIHSRRKGSEEARVPTVQELWEQESQLQRELDLERGLRRQLEVLFHNAVDAFRTFAARARAGGSTDLTDLERTAMEAQPVIPKSKKEHHE